MKPLIAAAAVVLLAGCSAASPPHHARKAVRPLAPRSLAAAQGARICGDLAAWLPGAENRDRPRFSAKLAADEGKARGTRLGTDLEGLGSDLVSENGVALSPGPPGDPQNIQLVRADCKAYGVTVPQG